MLQNISKMLDKSEREVPTIQYRIAEVIEPLKSADESADKLFRTIKEVDKNVLNFYAYFI